MNTINHQTPRQKLVSLAVEEIVGAGKLMMTPIVIERIAATSSEMAAYYASIQKMGRSPGQTRLTMEVYRKAQARLIA